LQYRRQSHQKGGRLRARRHPQGDKDYHPGVSRRPRVFAFVSAPIDTPHTTSHTPLLAVCTTTASVPREQPLSPRASRATRCCNRWGRPLGAQTRAPECLPFCQRPLTHYWLSRHIPALSLLCSLRYNQFGNEGASALAAVLKETKITNLECAAAPECSHLCQRPLTLLPSHKSHPCPYPAPLAHQSQPYPCFAVSGTTTSETRAPPRSQPSSRRR